MFAPAMSKLSVNLIADQGDACITCPHGNRLYVGVVKHAPSWITRCIHEQDSWIGSIAEGLVHSLRKRLRSQAVAIFWVGLHANYSPACKPCLGSIANP